MKLHIVYPLTIPSSHSTIKMTAIVSNISLLQFLNRAPAAGDCNASAVVMSRCAGIGDQPDRSRSSTVCRSVALGIAERKGHRSVDDRFAVHPPNALEH